MARLRLQHKRQMLHRAYGWRSASFHAIRAMTMLSFHFHQLISAFVLFGIFLTFPMCFCLISPLFCFHFCLFYAISPFCL